MPLSIICPSCGVRLRAPDQAAGRTLACPKCTASLVVPTTAAPSDALAFDAPRSTYTGYSDDEGNPFDDEAPEEPPSELDSADPAKKSRRPASKKKPKAGGFNPFDEETAPEEPAAEQTKRRRYRKDGDYNPFGDHPVEEVPDLAGDGFDFGIEAPPTTPTNEFDFGSRNDDDARRG
ncbi:MAG TPA: hypothetical protein VHR66_10455 [Gemmataceae bacterium]|jgi:hypothetical protein|nr:hypothetical protein [Gemmataceae bacterium]